VNDSSMVGPYLLGAIVAAAIAIWVAIDANKRGMNGIGWGIGVFLLCIVFLPIYLLTRKPLLPQAQPYGNPPPMSPPQPPQEQRDRLAPMGGGAPPYGQPLGPSVTQPPPLQAQPQAQPAHHFCSNCGTQLPLGAKFCASCGRAV